MNQDALGRAAARVRRHPAGEVWKKPLSEAAVAVAVVNRSDAAGDITLKAGDVGLLDGPKVARNLWTQQDIADFKESLDLRLEPHQSVLLKIARP